ncbi:MAG: hypothetical protein K2X47_17475, partial [Bdellovibrionales bacterium]|nr:hypothetical protein [Bdellovibrionales bacterium]
ASGPGLYSGAWQYPESASCCADSIGYAPVFGSSGVSQYGALTRDPLFLEKGRRMSILVTYDATNTGYTEDLIFGGQLVYKEWVNIAYPYHIISHLRALAQQPDVLAPNGENHLLESTAAIQTIQYRADGIDYSTLRAPIENIDVLRIAFEPTKILASGSELKKRSDLLENGYTLQDLKNGDFILKVRHDLANQVSIQGPNNTTVISVPENVSKPFQFDFTGNQVYLSGKSGPNGGQAKVKLDGQELLTPIDLWSPEEKSGVVWSAVGLSNTKHIVEIIPIQSSNPRTIGSRLILTQGWAVGRATSAAPLTAATIKDQKVILGSVARENLLDKNGSEWWPGLDVIFDFGGPQPNTADLVLPAFWTEPLPCQDDKCIYANGIHSTKFSYNFTALPGKYRLKIHFNCARSNILKSKMVFQVNSIQEFKDADILAECQLPGNSEKVVTLEKSDLSPMNGTVQIHFKASQAEHEAFASALELNPM